MITPLVMNHSIEEMLKLTPQEIFTETANYLRSMNEQSSSENDCVYFNKDTGNKCAVGYWIPKEYYEGIEFCVITELIEATNYDKLKEFLTKHIFLFSDLQEIHDSELHWSPKFNKYGEEDLKRTAKHFNLIYYPPQT